MKLLLCVLFSLLCASVVSSPARADEVQDRFDDAAGLVADGKPAEAASALELLARELPEHRLAPEALFLAAQLREEDLGDPGAALTLYRALAERYPDSRPALAASRRAESLGRLVGEDRSGVEPQRRFAEIRQRFRDRPEAESMAKAEALLRDFPGWAGAPRVALWLAEIDVAAGRYQSALERYLAASRQLTDEDARFSALVGAGDAALRLGDLDAAERYYSQADAGGDPGRRAVRAEAMRELGAARGRARWHFLALAVILIGAIVLVGSLLTSTRSARAALRALWPPPTEALYLAPVGAFLAVVAYTDYQGFGPAITLVATGGLAVTWLSGAALAARAREGARRRLAASVVHAVAAAAVIVSLVYVSLYHTELIDPVLDTIREGPDF